MRASLTLPASACSVAESGGDRHHRRRTRPLSGLGRLAELNLSETGVTDAAVIHLAKLPALKSLTLHSTAVSGKGLRDSARSPGCDGSRSTRERR